MASAAATHQPLRIVSRRGQILLQKHRAVGSPKTEGSAAARSLVAPKKDETPWPKSIRYGFYVICVASVPFSIGQAIAMSPRLRERLSSDDEEDEEGSSSGFSWNNIISLVRRHWGHDDYVPPVDRPQPKHVVPGHRYGWEEDNYSSFLKLVGMYDAGEAAAQEDEVPVSFDNEPPAHVRRDQRNLSRYLSPKTNPSGVRTKLYLMPPLSVDDVGGLESYDAAYETECTLPGSVSASALRALCQGSDAQVLKRNLAESDPLFLSVSTDERIRTKSWNENCRWAVSFVDSDGDKVSSARSLSDGILLDDDFGESKQSASSQNTASKALRHKTAVNSSWTYFPDTVPPVLPTGTRSQGASGLSSQAAPNENSLRAQRLQHQIDSLERELRDPSSMRDRDGMYEELRSARRELRGLKPWWRRLWG